MIVPIGLDSSEQAYIRNPFVANHHDACAAAAMRLYLIFGNVNAEGLRDGKSRASAPDDLPQYDRP
jgi:hypothetical protein